MRRALALAVALLIVSVPIASLGPSVPQAPGSPGLDTPADSETEIETEAEEDENTNGAEAIAFRHLQMVDENGAIPANALLSARAHVDEMRGTTLNQGLAAPSAGIDRSSWEWLGPGNIGGRIRSILIDPAHPDTMWVGSATGGIFKTTNGGSSWIHEDDFMSNLAVSSLVSHPSAPNTIYAATGEDIAGNRRGGTEPNGNRGAGVFKSVDGGPWTQLASTATSSSWWYTNRLAVDPDAPSTLLAATWGGIFKTTNGGTSWDPTLTSAPYAIQDIDYDPSDGTKAIAGSWGLAYYSTDGGDTWHSATGIPSTGNGRIEVAYSASNPLIVYASVDLNGGAIYRSADGGHSYSLSGPTSGDNYLGTQGNYGNALWVSPTNPDRLIVGGVDLYQSTDQGATLTKISDWEVNQNHVRLGTAEDSAHADHHVIVANPSYPTDLTVFFGNDGGIYKTSNILTVTTNSGWQELNNNLGITQFYGATGNVSSGTILGGTQDNGTLRYNGASETWSMTFGGDGGFSASDPTNPLYYYGEYVSATVFRSSNGGSAGADISGVLRSGGTWTCPKATQYEIADACSKTANFIAPMVLDPSNPQRLLVGGLQLWRTEDARATVSSTVGPTWAGIKPSIGYAISAIAIDPTNSDLVYVGHNNGSIYRSENATATSPTWVKVDPAGLPNRIVLDLTIDPTDPDVVYATFGGFSTDNLYRLSDGNTNWADRTGSGLTGLPDAPVRSLVVNPAHPDWLYAGTELGVFTSEDAGLHWEVPNNGPANVPVDELFLMGDQLVAATYGRGVFRAQIGGVAICPPDDGHEPNNSRGTATSLTDGQTINGISCDDDYYAVSAVAGQKLTADLTFTNANGDLDMRLYDSQGTYIKKSDSTTDNETIAYDVSQSGTYFLRVYGYLVAQNSYALHVGLSSSDVTAPTIGKPTITFPSARLQQTTVPVKVKWSASDNPGGSGLARFRLQQRTNGGPWQNVNLASNLQVKTVRNLQPGKHYEFRAKAWDAAGNASTWHRSGEFELRASQETSHHLSYSGGWARRPLTGAYGGSVKYATAGSAVAAFTFRGRSVGWVSTQAPKRGIAKVYVDGAKVATIDLSRPSRLTRFLVWKRTWGRTRSHEVRIVVSGTSGRPRVDVDAFVWTR